MTSVALVGSTGLVGSNILSQLLAHPSFTTISAYTRRDLPNPTSSSKLHPITSTDTTTWASSFPRSPTTPSIFISSLGTTRAQAGSATAQRKIDYDLNVELAQAAKNAGVETYVLISTHGANVSSYFAYPKMKGELEDAVRALGFKHCVILRPGLIVGDRVDSRPSEAVLRGVAKGLGGWSLRFTDWWAQDKGVIAKAAVEAAVMCSEGKREGGVWVLAQADVVRLGTA